MGRSLRALKSSCAIILLRCSNSRARERSAFHVIFTATKALTDALQLRSLDESATLSRVAGLHAEQCSNCGVCFCAPISNKFSPFFTLSPGVSAIYAFSKRISKLQTAAPTLVGLANAANFSA